jgi:cell division transport system permease protein
MNNIEKQYYKRKKSKLFFSLFVSLFLMFLLLGIFGLLILNAGYLNNYFKEQLTLSVYFKDDTPRSEIKKIEKSLKNDTLVKKVIFVSKEKAAERAKEILGDDFIAVLGENPLQDNVEIRLHAPYVNEKIFSDLRDRLLQNKYVDDVVYEKTILDALNRNVRKIGIFILVFSFILLIIIYYTVRNTVRLSIYNRRHVIKTMQLVGAPEGFIMRPYLISYSLLGLFSGLAAVGVLVFASWKLQFYFPALHLVLTNTYFYLLLGGLILFSFLISITTGFFAARSVLRMHTDDIHF